MRKVNGEEYEPDSLKVMLAALDRHLKDNGFLVSIISGREFVTSKNILEGKARLLRQSGKGKKPNRAESLTDQEKTTLWDCGQLGDSNSRSLLNAIWCVVQQFGLRGRDNHYNLKMEEFSIKIDNSGRKYVQFIEGPSKTRQGGLNYKQRNINPRMYGNGGDRCPVRLFELYKAKRPAELRNSGPLFLAVIDNPKNPDVWYKNSRLGIIKLATIMKSMIQNSPLKESSSEKHITNYSARKRCVRKLKSAGFQKCEIKNVTGHSKEEGLDAYDSGNGHDLFKMSNALVQQKNMEIKADKKESSPQRNFSFGIDWDKHSSNKQQIQGKIIFNNCTNVSLTTTSHEPKKKKKRLIIYSSSEEE